MLEFQAGFGGLNLKFYDPRANSVFSYSIRSSSISRNHLQLHAAAGLRIYLKDHVFIRPQVDYHWVRNLIEFSSNSVPQYTLAIGYNFGD